MNRRFANLTVGCAALLLLAGIPAWSGTAGAQPANPDNESFLLPGVSNGRGAVAALGANLPEAARRNGVGVQQLREYLEADETAHIDRRGRFYFVEPTAPDATQATGSAGNLNEKATPPGKDGTLAPEVQAARRPRTTTTTTVATTSTSSSSTSSTSSTTTSSTTTTSSSTTTTIASTTTIPPTTPTTIAPPNALRLHSRPGASRVIFLDFDGQWIRGTGWNNSYTANADFYAEGYTIDADPAFSVQEQDTITAIWKRIAEDYAPLNVDVTTEEPTDDKITRSSSTDTLFGTRLVVTSTNTIYSSCSCGGIAYVGVFDQYGTGSSAHSYYQPALVFTRGVGTGAKNITEAASHEIGHNVGLRHDGTASTGYYTGHGDWAPIMGVGYSKSITQFNNGTYPGANNFEDDFVTMQSNGAPLVADEVSSSVGIGASAAGVISTRTDVDTFTFTAPSSAAYTVSASPALLSPNLDIRLTIRNGSTVVAVVDPAAGSTSGYTATGLAATATFAASAGTVYSIEIDGTGYLTDLTGGYSDYGSLGSYTVSVG